MASLREVQEKWDQASSWYGAATTALEVLIFCRMRARLLKSAVGRMLEVATGTGSNVAYYPAGVEVVPVDLSLGMLAKALPRDAKKLTVVDAEGLAF